MGIDKLVQTSRHLVVVFYGVTLQDSGGQARQAGILDRVDQLVEALVLQQRFERVAVQIFCVLERGGND